MEVEVVRPKQLQDKERDYYLIVDGKKFTKIKPNSSIFINLPEGTEYIQAKIDWCGSKKVYVKNIISNQVVVKNSFEGKFEGKVGVIMFLPLYYITFGKGKYLSIESGDT